MNENIFPLLGYQDVTLGYEDAILSHENIFPNIFMT